MIEMKFSVIVPFYNDYRRLEKVVQSLRKQTFSKEGFEIILVDDGSTRKIPGKFSDFIKSVPKPGIKIVCLRKNKGSYAARNEGIKNARGEILIFTDSDCLPRRRWLESFDKAFKNASSDVAGFYGKTITEKTDVAYPYPYKIAPCGHQFVACNVAYKVSILKKVGGFDSRFRSRGDSELGRRIIKESYKVEYAPKAVVFHPLKTIDLKYIFFDFFKRRQYDNLLFKKHPNSSRRDLGYLIGGPILGPFSLSGIVFLTVFFFSVAILFLTKSAICLLFFLFTMSLLWFFFYVFFAYKLALPKGTKKLIMPSLKIRIRVAGISLVYLGVIIIARLIGSIRFKRLLL